MLRKEYEKNDEVLCDSETTGISSSRSRKPAASAEEWFSKERIKEWPLPVASEGELDLYGVSEKLKTRNEFKEDLCSHACILDDLLENIIGLECNLNKYAKHVLVVDNDEDEGSEDETIENDVVTETIDTTSMKSWRKSTQDRFVSSRQRSIEQTNFPGFDPNVLTPLPGSLEAPQLLNRITNIQNFHGSLKQLWKKYFLSEATVAIFQDTFWWWFLEKFQKTPENQACLFDRIADSFVGLFLSISSVDKDRFFQKYADCMAQAIYSAFCESFPLSFKHFDDDFRSDLLNLISEWTTGVKPPPSSCRKWQLSLLETDQIKALQEDRTNQLKSNLSFDSDAFLKTDQQELNLNTQLTHLSQTKLKQTNYESHQAGRGPDFQRVLFNIEGKSPLITHFLAANRLQFEEPAAIKKNLTRTEIFKYPPPFPTYQELIQERKRDAKIANKKYLSLMEESLEERRQMRNQGIIQQFCRIEDDLISRQSDVKTMNEKLSNLTKKTDREISAYSEFKDETLSLDISDDDEN